MSVPRTNEERRAAKEARRRPVVVTPLMRLGTLVGRYASDKRVEPTAGYRHWRAVDRAILEEAIVHIDERLQKISIRNARGRAQTKWLVRWQQRIAFELARRDAHPEGPEFA